MPEAPPGLRQLAAWAAISAVILAAPLGWRAAARRWGPTEVALPSSYLPALDGPRARQPFDATPIGDLQSMKPGYVIIGDSMAGRIDWDRLTSLTGTPVAPLLQNATGSAYWYLAFKNYVVKSGITPKWVIVFFRDNEMTDPMFRIGEPSHAGLDEIALDHEDELNGVVADRVQGPWHAADHFVDSLYDVEHTRGWVEPQLAAFAAALVVRNRRRRETFADDVNGMFSLEHLRPMQAADIAAAEDRDWDFASNVKDSVLPLFLQLARERNLHVCFVRVLRRPDNGRPPPETPRMTTYVRDLRAYIERNGGVLRDDRDDPEMAKVVYADGDHIDRGERVHYTNLFFAGTPIFK